MVHHAKSKRDENVDKQKSKMSSSKSLSIKLDRIKDAKVNKKKRQKEVLPTKRRLRNNANEVVTISDSSDEENSSHNSSVEEIEFSNSKIPRSAEDVSHDDDNEDNDIGEVHLSKKSTYIPTSDDDDSDAEKGSESSDARQRNKKEEVRYKPGPKSKRKPIQEASNHKDKSKEVSAHSNAESVNSSQMKKKYKPGPKCKTHSSHKPSNRDERQENDSKKPERGSEENGKVGASNVNGEESDVEPVVIEIDGNIPSDGDLRKTERKSSGPVDLDDASSNESSALHDIRRILHGENTKVSSNSNQEESDEESGHENTSNDRKKSRSHNPRSTNLDSGRSIGSSGAHGVADKKLEILPNIFLTRLDDATLKSAEDVSITATVTRRVGRIKTTKPSGKRPPRSDPESEGDEVDSTDDDKRKKTRAKKEKARKQRKTKEKKRKYSSDESGDSDESDFKRRSKRKSTKRSHRKRDSSSEEESDEESESDNRRRKTRQKSVKRKERRGRRRSSEDSDSESDDDRRHRRSRKNERRKKDESSSSDRSRRKKKRSRRRSPESEQSESSEEDRRGRKRRSLKRGSKKKRRSTSESEYSDESSGERWGTRSKKKSNRKKTTKRQQKRKKKKKESTSESSEREIFASSDDEMSGDEEEVQMKKEKGKKQSPRKKKEDETSEEEILSPSKLKEQLENESEESELDQRKETSRLKVVEKGTEQVVETKTDKGRKRKLPELSSSGDEVSEKPTKKRKMIVSDEEDDSDGEEGSDDEGKSDGDDDAGNFGRKNIRKIMKTKKISKITKKAELQEKRRKERISERQKHYNEWVIQETGVDNVPVTKRMILEKDEESGDVIVEVSSRLIKNLKPHQVEATQFMWNCLIESVARYKKEGSTGSGCILAHCMGLGKTLSVITIAHTVMKSKLFDLKRVLIICPLNTVLNWLNEWKMWIQKKDGLVELYAITSGGCDQSGRITIVRNWHRKGGVLIVGYDMFRNLALGNRIRNKKIKVELEKYLLDPGPDLVVCDEGHLMKNPESSLSKVVNRIKTRRRIVLTGTPLQNNLKEYYTMVSFVKPNLLGSKNEFANRFVNPITNGQHSNSTSYDVKLMKKRAHILYKTLDGCVHRRDYSALTKYLPPKYEYIIYVRLSDVQRNYYSQYLQRIDAENIGMPSNEYNSNKSSLFMNQQVLYRIWTHPYCLKLHEKKMADKDLIDDDDDDDFISDGVTDSDESSNRRSRKMVKYKEHSTSESEKDDDEDDEDDEDEDDEDDDDDDEDDEKKLRRGEEVVKKWGTKSRGNGQENSEKMDFTELFPSQPVPKWWHENYEEDFCDKVELSGKMSILMHILRMCSDIGDKVIVFSQSLISLDLIEHFLAKIDEQNNDTKMDNPGGFSLLDGSDIAMDDNDDKSEKSTSKVVSKESGPSEETPTYIENMKSGNEETDDIKGDSNDAKDASNKSVTSNSSATDGPHEDADGGDEDSKTITKEKEDDIDDTGEDMEKPTNVESSDKNERREDTDEKESSEERKCEENQDEKSKSDDDLDETKSKGEREIEGMQDGKDTNVNSDADKDSNPKDETSVEVMDTTECESTSRTEHDEKPVNGEVEKGDNDTPTSTENVLHNENDKVGDETVGKDDLINSISLTNMDMPDLSLNSAAAKVCGIQGFESQLGYNSWIKGLDYHRLDGSTSVQTRKQMAETFNDVLDNRLRLFLISTRAGGLGINLVAANRVVIFDASWNPSHDVQSIFRTYRFGQTKPVYVYRLIAQGTMEEKIYNRQVTKQSLSSRVIDEMNIERHYSESDLADLYNFTPDIYDPDNRGEKPALPRDRLLADLIDDHPDLIQKYHVHDSLLENKGEDDLTEEEISEAWQEFEMEKKRGVRIYPGGRAPVANYLSDAEIAERQILHFAQALCQMHPQLYGMMRDRVCMVTPHLTQQPVNLCRMTNEFVLNVLKLTPVQFAQEYGRWMQEQQRQRLMQQLIQQQQQIAQQLQQQNLPPQIVNQLQAQQLMVRQQQNELVHQEQMIQQSQPRNQTEESNQGQQRRLPTLSNPIVIDADD